VSEAQKKLIYFDIYKKKNSNNF